MLFERRLRDGIADGSITAALRRWRRPQAVAGGRYRTGRDIIEMTEVRPVTPTDLVPADARDAGFPDVSALLADTAGRSTAVDGADGGGQLYLLRFRQVTSPDPRAALAADTDLDEAAIADLQRRLARLDRAAPGGGWTAATLAAIAERPGVRATELATALGREDTAAFKLDVRKLKALGLTESLPVGYRLSPRGEAYRNRS